MKIVDRETFLDMPEGTVYAKIEKRWIVDTPLCVKYESTDYGDWYYMSFDWVDANNSNEAIDRLEDMAADPKVSYPVQSSISRDGLFEEGALFLIYERGDLDFIAKQLRRGGS